MPGTGGHLVSEVDHGARIGRVESDVQSMRESMGALASDVTGLKADVRGLGSILGRIEQGVASAQQQWQDDKQASRINPIALTTVLVSVISILVGGAWLVSGGLATNATRLEEQDRSMARTISLRDREFDSIQRRLDRLEERRGIASAPNPQ